MKKLLILAMILIPLLTGIMLLNAEPAEYTHSFTKAICTEDNYCQDYEIMCKGNKTMSMTPITGAAVQFSENWEDPRNEETIRRFCD